MMKLTFVLRIAEYVRPHMCDCERSFCSFEAVNFNYYLLFLYFVSLIITIITIIIVLLFVPASMLRAFLLLSLCRSTLSVGSVVVAFSKISYTFFARIDSESRDEFNSENVRFQNTIILRIWCEIWHSILTLCVWCKRIMKWHEFQRCFFRRCREKICVFCVCVCMYNKSGCGVRQPCEMASSFSHAAVEMSQRTSHQMKLKHYIQMNEWKLSKSLIIYACMHQCIHRDTFEHIDSSRWVNSTPSLYMHTHRI